MKIETMNINGTAINTVPAVLPHSPGHETVVFVWSTEHGKCDDCGLPAAYLNSVRTPLCSVCAAGAAAEGDTISRMGEA